MTDRAIRNRIPPWGWMFVALGAHTGWGAYPVLARYLQTVSQLPSMSLLFLGNLVVLILLGFVVLPRTDPRVFRSHVLWVFAFAVVGRAVTNLLAARYTLAIYVQLITLMTPFLVALLGAGLLHEPIPPYTGRAIAFSLSGAVLMVSGDVGATGISLALTPTDWLGIGLAFVSSFFLALYMLIVRRTTRHALPGGVVFFTQIATLVAITAALSLLLREDWSRWRAMEPVDWVVFAAFSGGVLLGANMGQIGALRHLGAPLVSTLLPWRLVSALAVAALLLGERLTTLWQGIGALMVLVTLSWYLWQQRG